MKVTIGKIFQMILGEPCTGTLKSLDHCILTDVCITQAVILTCTLPVGEKLTSRSQTFLLS